MDEKCRVRFHSDHGSKALRLALFFKTLAIVYKVILTAAAKVLKGSRNN